MFTINSTDLVGASVSALIELCAKTFNHNARTRYILLKLVAKLDTKVAHTHESAVSTSKPLIESKSSLSY